MCATTRAIILDFAEDRKSKLFVNSTKKFIARQGCSTKFVSDIGTNQREIRTFVQAKVSNSNSTWRVEHGAKVFGGVL